MGLRYNCRDLLRLPHRNDGKIEKICNKAKKITLVLILLSTSKYSYFICSAELIRI